MSDVSDSAPAVAAPQGQSQEFPRPFGQYLLLHRLARGGMGEVYLAKHGNIAGIEKYCVVKTLRGNYTVDREYVARFIDEARVVVQLNHRNICQIFDVGRVGQQYFLAMEFIVGRDLRTIQTKLKNRGQTLGHDLILHVVCEVLEALDYAHRHADPVTGESLRLVHRDVSPQNVMVNFEGEIKLIDFGLAQSTKKVEQTQPHVVMGKMQYMAPEQARGDGVDGRADQFAVAMLLYELLAGERFYEAMSFDEIWQIAGRGGFTPRKMDKLDDALRGILEKALAENRDNRFDSCGDFREALLGYQFDNRMRAGSRNVRGFMMDAFPDDAIGHRELLSRFQNVSAMPQSAPEEPKEESKSFARSRPNESSPVIPLRPDENTLIDGEALGDTMAQDLSEDATSSRDRFAAASSEDQATLELTADQLPNAQPPSEEDAASAASIGQFRSMQVDTDSPFDSPTPSVGERSAVVQNKTQIIRPDEIPARPGHGDPLAMAPRKSRMALMLGVSGGVIAILLGVVVGLVVLKGDDGAATAPDPVAVADPPPQAQPEDPPADPPADEVAAPADPPADEVAAKDPPADPPLVEEPKAVEDPAPVNPEPKVVRATTSSPKKPRKTKVTKKPRSKRPSKRTAKVSDPAPKPAPKPAPPVPKKSYPKISPLNVKAALGGTPFEKRSFLKDQACFDRGATCSRKVLSGMGAAARAGGEKFDKWKSDANKCIKLCARK